MLRKDIKRNQQNAQLNQKRQQMRKKKKQRRNLTNRNQLFRW